MSAPHVYYITGANRGIGLSLVKEIASKSADKQVIVFAGVRDPASATALKEISDAHPGVVEIVKYIAADVPSNQAAAETIKAKVGHIDTVIASAGIGEFAGSVLTSPPDAFTEHFHVNATSVVILFQSTYALLKASKATPRFIPMSTSGASLTLYISFPMDMVCYGASKAALNYIARKIHFENDWLVCMILAPGIVMTDMAKANRESDKSGVLGSVQDEIALEPAVAAPMLMGLIDNATREKDGGEFVNVDGTKLPW